MVKIHKQLNIEERAMVMHARHVSRLSAHRSKTTGFAGVIYLIRLSRTS